MSAITTETATVYRGGGRRFFTKTAAMKAEAKAVIRKRCECERPDHHNQYPGYVCPYHSDAARYHRAMRLLIAMFIRPSMRHQGGRP